MKKNSILGAVLILLLTFTYYYQELGSKKKQEELNIKNRIIDIPLKGIDKIILKNTILKLVNGKWMVENLNFPADPERISSLLEHLLSIHQLKKLSENSKEQYFSVNNHEIAFSSPDKKWVYRLGDVSEITGNFYFQDETGKQAKTYLAIDVSEFSGLYKTELELMLNKYLNLKDLITASPLYFIDKNIFRDVDFANLSSIKIDNKWNRWFEVNFTENITIPKIYPGLEYLNLKKKALELIEKVEIEKIIPRDEEILKSHLCSVTMLSADAEVLKVEVYGQAGVETGIFATTEKYPNWTFKLNTKARDFFFSNVQQYWNKKLFFQSDLEGIKSIDFKIGDSTNLYSFYVENVEEFEIKTNDERVGKINRSNTNFLFHLLFSLTQFVEAHAVFQKVPQVTDELLKLQVQILNHAIEVILTSDKVYLVNKSDNVVLEYLFPAGDYRFNSIEDFFALK